MKRRLLIGFGVATLAFCAGFSAQAGDNFGALAYSPSHAMYTLALNHPTRRDAEETALAACRTAAPDCTTPVWVRKGCMALAIGRGLGFGTGWGATRASAEQEAMTVCSDRTRACVLRRTACTAE